MKRALLFSLSFALTVMIGIAPVVATAEAASNSRTVNVSQRILPPDCFDTVSKTGPTTDYIAVFECEYQRP